MKGIKFFGILAAASLLFSVSAFAQENNNRDENGNVVKGPYVTNPSVWDNAFIGVAGGINLLYDGGFNHGIGVATDLTLGKWFTPTIGLRAGWQGLNLSNRTPAHPFVTGAGDVAAFNYIHGDVMWNMIQGIWGYKETRVWNLAPYLTMGISTLGDGDGVIFERPALAYTAGLGLYNQFRLSDKWDFTADIRGLIVPGKEIAGGFMDGILSVTVGLAYKLGKTGFNRLSSVMPVVIPVPFTTDQYNALADKVKALEAENSELKDKIAALEDENAKLKNMLTDDNDYVYEDGQFKKVSKPVATPATVYFNIDSAVISEREKAHLEFYAENLAEDAQLLLVGSADKETGTAAYNQKLSEKRAEAVKKYFVSKGVSADNIETRGEGSSNNVYNTPAKNRACTIRIK